jgi:hypothetical protein
LDDAMRASTRHAVREARLREIKLLGGAKGAVGVGARGAVQDDRMGGVNAGVVLNLEKGWN